MRLTKSIIAAMTVAVIALSSSLTLKSDVPGEFKSLHLVQKNYEPIVGGTVLDAVDFIKPPAIQDADDGYAKISIGFPFEYNGEVYTELWICVNGFITFDSPNFLKQANPTGLFKDLPSTYQQNVVAPFWGDHVYRTDIEALQLYTRTRIIYKRESDKLTIEWRDLNINDKTKPSSIADFQVILYKSDDPATPQGDIEFAYGQIGGNTLTTETEVITRGASVGIKGEFDDFINGLWPCTDDPADSTFCVLPQATDSTNLSNAWQPSGASNYRILFTAQKTLNVEEFWGDGDVDFSKTPAERHFGLPQNRYVTFNDVRLILRSMATQVPLDSVRRRAAYHGDVNHNGRYFYRTVSPGVTEKVEITTRSMNYFDDLPSEVTSLKKVFYQVNEHDAAVIMTYLAASVPELPWVHDTTVFIGKKAQLTADNIVLGEKVIHNGVTSIPVYINKNHNGPLSFSFDVNGTVENVELNIDNEIKLANKSANGVYFASTGEFTSSEPVLYVDVTNLDGNLQLNNIRVNDNNVGSIVEQTDVVNASLSLSTNPYVSGFTSYTVAVENSGLYTLSVYDAVGNKVATVFNEELRAGESIQRPWSANDFYGNELNSGVYFLKLEGNNVNKVQKVIINR
jgi:hypothetical protein